MKKTLLSLGALAALTPALIAVVSCSALQSNDQINVKKAVDKVKAAINGGLKLTDVPNPIPFVDEKNPQELSDSVLNAFGGTKTSKFPDLSNVRVQYSTPGIAVGGSGYLQVMISSGAAKSDDDQDLQIPITVKNNADNAVDSVVEAFAEAHLSVESSKTIAAQTVAQPFTQDVWKQIGEKQNGTYPRNPLPSGVTLTYKIATAVNQNQAGIMQVLVNSSHAGVAAKVVNIPLAVGMININSASLATTNIKLDQTSKDTLIIPANVWSIDFDLSSIKSWGGVASKDIKHIKFADPTKILNIGNGAFWNFKLTDPAASSIFDNLTNLVNIGDFAFNNAQFVNVDLSHLTNLVSIGEGAFNNDTQLVSLTISNLNNLALINASAFSQSPLKALNLLNLPNLTMLGDYAFASVTANLVVKMSDANWAKFISDTQSKPAVDRLARVFGANSSTVQHTNH